MGLGLSVHPSLIHNDFELVIRCAKEMEHVLRVLYDFGKNEDKMGLGEMIRAVDERNLEPRLSKDLVKRIKHLNWMRNQLVHDRDCNKIDRKDFVASWKQSEKELEKMMKHAGLHK